MKTSICEECEHFEVKNNEEPICTYECICMSPDYFDECPKAVDEQAKERIKL